MVDKGSDRYAWMRETAEHLRDDDCAALDFVAMAEWFDEMSGSDRREVMRRLRSILEHRLKLGYVVGPELERNRRGWELTIAEQSAQLADIFEESPSLRHLLTVELLARLYASVRGNVAKAYGFNPPLACPYRYRELLEVWKRDL